MHDYWGWTRCQHPDYARPTPPTNVEMMINENMQFQQFLARNLQIKNKDAHLSLRNALIDHIWEHYGNNPID